MVKVTLEINTTLINPKIIVSFSDPSAVISTSGIVLQNT